MASASTCVRMLESEEMVPFWKEIDRLLASANRDLRARRDIAILNAIEALESVKALPGVLSERK